MFTRFSVVASAAVVAAVLPAPAHAQGDAEVARHFALGNDYYAEGRYADALVEYDAAYALSHNWKLLFNRGQCLVLLKREPDAIRTFERYLADGGAEIDPQRRASVEADLGKLRERLGHIRLLGVPAGAHVYLDDREIGVGPFDAPFPVGAGAHAIEIDPRDGRPRAKVTVRIAAGTTIEKAIELAPKPPAPAPAPAPVATPVAGPPALPDSGLYLGAATALVTGGRLIDGCSRRDCYASSRLTAPWVTGRVGFQASPLFAMELSVGVIGTMTSSVSHRGSADGEFHERDATRSYGISVPLEATDDVTLDPAMTFALHAVLTPIHETFRLSLAFGAGFTSPRTQLQRNDVHVTLDERVAERPQFYDTIGSKSPMWLGFLVPELRASFALPLDLELGLSAGAFVGFPESRTPRDTYAQGTLGGTAGVAILSTPDVTTGPFVAFESSLFVAKRFGR